jgi:hypothetical protein
VVLREQGTPEQGMGNNKQGNVLTLVVTAISSNWEEIGLRTGESIHNLDPLASPRYFKRLFVKL